MCAPGGRRRGRRTRIPAPDERPYDAILIGVGLASTACARALAAAGLRVGLVEGAGRSRSLAVDGGLVDAGLLARVFAIAPEALPLDRLVDARQGFRGDAGAVTLDPIAPMATRQAFRRDVLEDWALERATETGAEYLEGFTEGTVVPVADGSLTLMSEDGARRLSARMIALCEGSDPRIALRIGLRPDYGPAEQIHFAKTWIDTPSGADIPYRRGSWRTSWGMPVEVAVTPFESGATVWLAARIENVMRSSRSAVNALDDLFASRAWPALLPEGGRAATGVELVALRSGSAPDRFALDNLLVGVDASGMIDPRAVDRFDNALRSGEPLSTWMRARLTGEWPTEGDASWDDMAGRLVRELAQERGTFRDSRASGFLEEATCDGPMSVRRLRDGVLTRLRRR
jgi:flavin-dependent dehydrogenase